MTDEQIESIITALTKIAHGGTAGPTGFEALAMAIAGDGLNKPLSAGMTDIADSLQSIADNIDRLIDEVKNLKYNI